MSYSLLPVLSRFQQVYGWDSGTYSSAWRLRNDVQRGICKLCILEKKLVQSHLLPASLYKYCKVGHHSPILLGGGVLRPTDKQTKDHLLCQGCEDILSGRGETWIGPRLATWQRKFPFYDLLTKLLPDRAGDGINVYFANRNPEIKTEQLAHFAMGIFWKAASHSWDRRSREPKIELGPYRDQVRTWLRGESEFPERVYLRLVVATPLASQIALLEPYETRGRGWHHFLLAVPGLLFLLDVGKTVGEAERALCMWHNPEKPILVCDEFMQGFARMMARETKESRKTEAYQRAMQKIRAFDHRNVQSSPSK